LLHAFDTLTAAIYAYNLAMGNPTNRPTFLEVDLSILKQNLANIRSHVHPAKVMTVLKANAYGHGVDGVAQSLAAHSDYIGVAIAEEGMHLRSIGVQTPILVMGGTLAQQIPLFIEHQLTLTVSSLELLEAAEAIASGAGARLKVHLKVDTGMERIGVHEYEARSFLEKSLACPHLDIEGIFTHFANSEAADRSHAQLQLGRFNEVLAFYTQRRIPGPKLRHMANSGAILQLPESHMDMVRAGLMLYGVYPGPDAPRSVDVSPALAWRSRIVHSKITLAGRPVSYGSTWAPERDSQILTIPCGYGDGYFRRMTNRAQVIIRGKKYAQVGRICMDQFMVNAIDDEFSTGEEVLLLGKASSGEAITVEDLAQWAGTSEYEILTNISARVPRVFVS
jgi:alanine racemase